jgi:hypothetical protein
MLEQAKENLRSGFTAFGLVEHFDESLVLFRRLLGLRTIIYIQQRVATRPRGSEVPQEAVRLAERFNRHDMELYRWAREQFEQMVTDEEIDFAADVAALQTARGGGVPRPSPVEAADAKALWELLVRTRSELFVDHRDRARAEVAGRRGDTSRLLESLDHRLAELSSLAIAAPLAVEEAPVSEEPPTQPRPQDRKGRPRPAGAAKPRERPVGAGKDRNHPAGAGKGRERPAEGGNGRVERPKRRDRLTTRAARVAESRDHAVARLEDVQARLQALESRPGVSVESERLREEAANLQRRVDMLSTRCAQISSRLGATAADDADGGDPTAG